jgi:hypothetical protein
LIGFGLVFGLILGLLFSFVPNVIKIRGKLLEVRLWQDETTSLALYVDPLKESEVIESLTWAQLPVEKVAPNRE